MEFRKLVQVVLLLGKKSPSGGVRWLTNFTMLLGIAMGLFFEHGFRLETDNPCCPERPREPTSPTGVNFVCKFYGLSRPLPQGEYIRVEGIHSAEFQICFEHSWREIDVKRLYIHEMVTADRRRWHFDGSLHVESLSNNSTKEEMSSQLLKLLPVSEAKYDYCHIKLSKAMVKCVPEMT
jgi:hypothetical protein